MSHEAVKAPTIDFLNPNLDIPKLQEAFARQGYVQVINWLRPELVTQLQYAVGTNEIWDVRITDLNGGKIVCGDQLKEMGLNNRLYAQSRFMEVQTVASKGFAYLFYVRDLPKLSAPIIHEFERWINGPFVQFTEQIAGKKLYNVVELLASCYGPGCFLRGHSDKIGQRALAFVMHLTPRWDPDYGGQFQMVFHADGRTETFNPHPNALMLFDVTGQYHYVTQVTTFCPENRLAVTGWVTDSANETGGSAYS